MPKAKKQDTDNSVAQRLAIAADHEGMYARDLVRFKHLLKSHNIKPKHVRDVAVVTRADHINAKLFAQLVAQYEKRPSAPQVPVTSNTLDPQPKAKVSTLFGHSIASIIRWMGYDLWSDDDVVIVLEQLNVQVSRETVRKQRRVGAAGKGIIPELSKADESKLYFLLEQETDDDS